MKKHTSLKEQWRYHFDRIMGKGTMPLIGLLSALCAVIIIAASFVTAQYSNGSMSFRAAVWLSFTHILSAGILGHDKTDNKMLLAMMTVVTFFGVFVASILIGIITSAFGTKLRELKKGNSPILEKNHTIILGFNDNIFILVSQLIEAYRNGRHSCIVILGNQPVETMKTLLTQHISSWGKTEIIFRSISEINDTIFTMAHLEKAKSIIINENDDMTVIKALLSVSCFLSEHLIPGHEPHVIASVREKENLHAAQLAGDGKAHIVYIKDMLARIIAHTTRKQGFSRIFTDFFDFEGNEFYREHFPQLAGLQFRDILCRFEDSVVIGIDQHGASGKGVVRMNPPMDTILAKDDLIIHFAADDNTSFPTSTEKSGRIQEAALVRNCKPEQNILHILVLGENEMLPDILKELDNYLDTGSTAELTVPAESTQGKNIAALSLRHLCVTYSAETNFTNATVSRLLEKDFTNVLILSDLTVSPETADNKTILLLLYLRDTAGKKQKTFQITSEIRSAETQNIARVINVHDFIVGTNLTNLIMTQYAEDPSREQLFNDILDADGSEIYMKPVRNYVTPGVPVTFYTVTKAACARNEIPLGYRHCTSEGENNIVLNPHKSDMIIFSENDQLVVVAEN